MPTSGALLINHHGLSPVTDNGHLAQLGKRPLNSTAKGYKAGDLIMRSDPWIYCLHPELISQYCYHCVKPFKSIDLESVEADAAHVADPIRCTGCDWVCFCSKNCMEIDCKERHKMECHLIRSLRATGASPAADDLLVLKAILRIKKNDANDRESACFPPTGRNFGSLLSHAEDYMKDIKRLNHVGDLRKRLAVIFWEGEELLKLDKLLEIYGKIKINSFDIRDENLRRIGEAVYFGPSAFNHSCQRNASFSFSGKEIRLHAMTDIADLSEVRLSYTDPFNLPELRCEELKHYYYFDCDCALCSDALRLADERAITCINVNCPAPRPLDQRGQGPCKACIEAGCKTAGDPQILEENKRRVELAKRLVDLDLKQHRKIHELWSKYSTHAKNSAESEKILSEIEWRCERVLDTARLLYHPENVVLGVTLDVLGRTLLATGDKEKRGMALQALRDTLPSLRTVCHPADHRLGVQLTLVALLELESLRRGKPAEDIRGHSSDAVVALQVSPGTQSQLYQIAKRIPGLAASLREDGKSNLKRVNVFVEKSLPVLCNALYSTWFPTDV